MSMDQSAIQELKKTELLNQVAAQLTGTNTPLAAVPDNFSLESLEQYLANRSRFRGNFATKSISDFSSYIGDQEPSVFIDTDRMTAEAIFNIGSVEAPGHCDNKSTLTLEKNSAYSALLQLHGKKLSQKELAEWIEDWNENVTVFDQEGETMTPVAAIGAIRRITISARAEQTHSEHDFGASRSAMEEIEAKAEERMPHGFQFKCIPYESLEEHTFSARFSVLTSHDKPVLSVRIVRLEAEQEDLANEFKEKLTEALPEKIPLYLGRFSAAN